MVSEELKGIFDQLNEKGKMAFLEPVTEEQILKFEIEKGFKLTVKYKERLLFSDGGECYLPGGIQLYGVAHKTCY